MLAPPNRWKPKAPSLVEQMEADLADCPVLLTLQQAAKLTGVSVRTLRRWISIGLVRVTRPCGGHPRIPRAELRRVLLEGLQ